MEFTFEGLDMTGINEVIKKLEGLDMTAINDAINKIDFDTFIKGIFYIGDELELIHNDLMLIRKNLTELNKTLFYIEGNHNYEA